MLWQLFPARRQPKSTNRSPRRRSQRLDLEILEDRWLLSTFTWIGATSGGDFNTATNWQDQGGTNAVPGSGDDAVIPGSDTVTVSGDATVNSVNGQLGGAQLDIKAGTFTLNNVNQNSDLSGFFLEGGATLKVNGGTTVLDGGTLAGTVDVETGGTLEFHDNTTTITGGSFIGTGQYLVAGGAFSAVTLNTDLTAPANFTLQSGTLNGSGNLTISGTFTWVTAGNGSATLGGSGTTTVQQGATLNITGSTGNSAVLDHGTLNNAGTINLDGGGEFDIRNGATLHNQAGGTFKIVADVNINGGVGNAGGISNDGTIVKTSPVNTGTTTVNVPLNNTGTVDVQSGQLAVSGGGTNSGTFTAESGTHVTFPNVFSPYTLNAGSQLNGAGHFDVNGGTLTLAGDATVSNLLLDSLFGTINGSGTLTPTAFTWKQGPLAAPTVIQSGDTLTISGGGSKNLNADLTNNGTVNVTSTTNLGISNTPTITNNGTFNLLSDVDLSGNALFKNPGTLTKSSPALSGTTGFTPQLINTGTVDVQSGVLLLHSGGSSGSSVGGSGGAWTVESGGTLDFSGGTMTAGTGTTFSGAGVSQVTTFGTLSVSGTVTAENFTIADGTVSGSGNFTVTGTLDWTGGQINNPNGTVNIPVRATLLLSGNNNKAMVSGTLNLAGATTWQDSGKFNEDGNATVNNVAGATFTILNDESLGGGSATFNNFGTFTKAAGSGTTDVSPFNNFTNKGGTIDVESGNLVFDNGNYVQTAGNTIIAAGAALGGTAHINGGTLSGAGNVNGNVINGGTVRPGDASSAGTLTVTGNYTQSASGTLAINVGGTTPGTQYSQLAVHGTATLGGALSLTSINNFTPALGATLTPITFASGSGSLTLGGTLTPGSGQEFDVARNATSLSVADDLIPPPPPPPPPPAPTPTPTPTPTPVPGPLRTAKGKHKKHHKKHH
jgi:hypothetical protein